MNVVVQNLVLNAMRSLRTADPRQLLAAIEHQLTPDQAAQVLRFLTWLNDCHLTVGHGNIDERLNEFQAAQA